MKIISFLALFFILSACTFSNPAPVITDNPNNTLILTTRSNNQLGNYVVNSFGFTVYASTDDDGEISHTNDNDFLPILAPDNVITQGGLDDNLIGVNGDGQVLYNNHLVYYFQGDKQPGDINAQGHDGKFYVLSSSGNPVV